MITLTALVAGGHHEELALHLRAARTNGLTVDEIEEACSRPRSTAASRPPTRRSASPSSLSKGRLMTATFVYAATRTPFGKFGGAYAEIRPDDLAATALNGVLAKAPELDPPRSATWCGATRTGPARTTAMSAGWPCCSLGCRSVSPQPPSTGSAAPAWTRR